MRRLGCLALLAMILGCGGASSGDADLRVQAAQAYIEASTAFESKDFAVAEPLFDVSIQGGLNADQIGTARAKRAICLAEAGDFAAAHQELDALEAGAPNLAEVFAARSYILTRQGKHAEANAAWTQAKRYNPSIKKLVN